MEDLIKTLNLKKEEQTFLPLSEGRTLSVVVESSPYHWGIDANGKVEIIQTPGAVKLHCAIQKGMDNLEYPTFYSEEEFYNFMKENKYESYYK